MAEELDAEQSPLCVEVQDEVRVVIIVGQRDRPLRHGGAHPRPLNEAQVRKPILVVPRQSYVDVLASVPEHELTVSPLSQARQPRKRHLAFVPPTVSGLRSGR